MCNDLQIICEYTTTRAYTLDSIVAADVILLIIIASVTAISEYYEYVKYLFYSIKIILHNRTWKHALLYQVYAVS